MGNRRLEKLRQTDLTVQPATSFNREKLFHHELSGYPQQVCQEAIGQQDGELEADGPFLVLLERRSQDMPLSSDRLQQNDSEASATTNLYFYGSSQEFYVFLKTLLGSFLLKDNRDREIVCMNDYYQSTSFGHGSQPP